MEPVLPPPSTAEVKSKLSYAFTPAIHRHGLPRGTFTCLKLRPHIGSVALHVLRDAHTDVQVCTADTRSVIIMQSINDTHY